MSVTSPQARERINQLSGQLGELYQRRAELKSARKLAHDHGDHNAEALTDLKLDEVQHNIDMATQLKMTLSNQRDGVSNYGGLGETIFSDPVAIAALEGVAATSAPLGNMLIGRVLDAEQLAAAIGRRPYADTGGPGSDLGIPDAARAQAPLGVVRALYRPTALLDLIPTAVMTGGSFTYLVETGEVDDTIGGTAAGALKPEDTSLGFDEGEVRAVTIAAWRKMRRAQLADVEELEQVVRDRLMYSVRRRIEAQVLAGDGTGENLLGVLHRTGLGSVAYDAGTPAADLLLRGLTTVRLSNASPTGIVLNPLTYESLLEEKGDDGHRLDSSGMFSGGTSDVGWGVPIVQTPAVSPDKALVADWGRAATLFVREGLTLRLSDSDQDDFVRNVITALAETRVGFAVWQPGAICEVQLAEAPEA